MRKVLLFVASLAMAVFAVAGLSYFGPPKLRLALHKAYPPLKDLSRALNRYFMDSSLQASQLAGQVSNLSGFYNFRSLSDFVSMPGIGLEEFYGKTLVSVESDSSLKIELPDQSILDVEENTMLVLYPPLGNGDIKLSLLAGKVNVEKSKQSKRKVLLYKPSGKIQSVGKKLSASYAPPVVNNDLGEILQEIKTQEIETEEVSAKVIDTETKKRIIKRAPASSKFSFEDKCDCDTCVAPAPGTCAVGSKNWYDFQCN